MPFTFLSSVTATSPSSRSNCAKYCFCCSVGAVLSSWARVAQQSALVSLALQTRIRRATSIFGTTSLPRIMILSTTHRYASGRPAPPRRTSVQAIKARSLWWACRTSVRYNAALTSFCVHIGFVCLTQPTCVHLCTYVCTYVHARAMAPERMQLAQADEPDWSWEASVPPVQTSPRVRRMWQQYLEMQGISPPALGHTSWEGVLPIGRGSAGGGFGALILPSCTYLSHH